MARMTPLHLSPRDLVLVGAGGVVGTALREALGLAFPPVDGFPYATLAVNLVGALLLGMLLHALLARGPDEGRRRELRLLLGTGALGGFTTYSALAADSAVLLGEGARLSAVLYGIGTVVLGAVATGIGVALGAAIGARRRPRDAGSA